MKSFNYSLVGRSPKGFPLGIVWNTLVSVRVIFFAWEVVWEFFLTLDQLKWRGWRLPSRSYLCKDEEEQQTISFSTVKRQPCCGTSSLLFLMSNG